MNLPRIPIRVVKVGGSLLNWPELPRALERWLAAQPPATHALLCGGGSLADAIRQAERNFDLSEEASHWLAVDTLHVTAGLLAALMPRARRVSTLADAQAIVAAAPPVLLLFDPCEFLRADESQASGAALPHSWQATSDSIAARLAEVLPADELILLKSSSPPADDLAALAAAGYVDAHFPQAARGLGCVRFVNLRGV